MKRRTFLSIIPAAAGAFALDARAQPLVGLPLESFGIIPDADEDQTAALQTAIDEAARRGLPLFLPAGTYRTGRLNLPSDIALYGIPGATILSLTGEGPLVSAANRRNITIDGLGFNSGDGRSDNLLAFSTCAGLNFTRLGIANATGTGLGLEVCQGSVENSTIRDCAQTGIHAQNSAGLIISGNTIADCGSGGIRVWRYENGRDGTIVTGNQISGIASPSGNGQNGNGINVFRANEVIITDNAITDCDFSAVRVNATVDSVISGNICSQIREITIFSEFGFSGSIISNNIIDEAAAGISITNFDHGGRLAVCANNIVRNIWEISPTNPDNGGFGISAQAEVAVSGNVVENVAGTGINAGWGPYLRNVTVDGNVVRDTALGISVSVVEEAGMVRVTDNIISGARRMAIAGRKWRDIIGEDLAVNPDQFDNVVAAGNTVS